MLLRAKSCCYGRRLVLAAGVVHSFTGRPGERIVCERGRVWLTQFDVREDFDLSDSMHVVIRTHGLVVIEAMEPSVLLLEVDSGGQELNQHSRSPPQAPRQQSRQRQHETIGEPGMLRRDTV